MTMEEYIIDRLTECEAENEDLRATNKLLADRLARLTGESMLLVRCEPGVYHLVSENRVWSLDYEYKFYANGSTYVVSLGTSPNITLIDDDRYFLSREKAEAKAKADQS